MNVSTDGVSGGQFAPKNQKHLSGVLFRNKIYQLISMLGNCWNGWSVGALCKRLGTQESMKFEIKLRMR